MTTRARLTRSFRACCAVAGCAALVSCGARAAGDLGLDAAGDEEAGVGPNACGGSGPVTFGGVPRAAGETCGPCGDGYLICGSLQLLVCAGASPSNACKDAQPGNACGGLAPLTYDGAPAAPGQACGPCGDGSLVCASPMILACIGASPSSQCAPDAAQSDAGDAEADAGLDGAWEDGTDSDAGSDAPSDSAPAQDATVDAQLDSGIDSDADANADADADAGADGGPSCTIPSSAYTQSAPPMPALPPETRPTTTTVTTLPLAVNRLVYDPFDGLLYASVPSSQGANGNSIAVIDPTIPAVLRTMYIGSEPNVLALSDDGQALWVGLDGAGAVRRFDTSTSTAGLQFSLPQSLPALDIAVLPGTEGSIAVSESYFHTQVIVFDDGVPRPYAYVDPGYGPTELAATYSPALLFAQGYTLSTLCMNASGVFREGAQATTLGGRLTFARGVLYGLSTGGAWGVGTVDIATLASLGTYVPATRVSAFAPDPATSRVFLLSDNSSPATITAFDQATFLAVATDSFNLTSPTTNLVRWGRYGFAFSATGPTVELAAPTLVIVRSANIPPQP